MTSVRKIKYILTEFKGHAPFTLGGALLGVVFMLLFQNISSQTSHILFNIFHPAHVVLSAVTTAAMFKLHSRKANFIMILIIGYVGSIGIATLSDSIIPYAGEILLGFHVEAHEHAPKPGNQAEHAAEQEQEAALLSLFPQKVHY